MYEPHEDTQDKQLDTLGSRRQTSHMQDPISNMDVNVAILKTSMARRGGQMK